MFEVHLINHFRGKMGKMPTYFRENLFHLKKMELIFIEILKRERMYV